jgi:hypothetical protein
MEISLGPLGARRIAVPQPSHLEGADHSIAVGNGRFRLAGGIVWVKTRAMNFVGDSGSPWRGEPRGNETEQG